MSRASAVGIIIVSVIASVIAVKMTMPAQSGGTVAEVKKHSAYDRVIKSNTLRCGYGLWPTYVDKDANTGKLSGIFYDYMNEVGKMTGVKIEWTMEVGYGDFIEALHSGKIDAFCSGAWTNTIRAKVVTMIQPIFYVPLLTYTRKDDTRFDNNLQKLNDPQYKFAVIDGEGGELAARQYFSKSSFIQLPQLTDPSQLLINVASGKADATLTDSVTANQYLKSNPNALHEVPSQYPVTIYGATVWIDQDEPELKLWMDAATKQLIGGGTIEQLLQKYEPFPNAYYRSRLDYISPAQK